jgi:hypothetical protein
VRGKLNPHPTLSKDGNHKYDGDGHKWQLSAQLEKKESEKTKWKQMLVLLRGDLIGL